MRKIANGTVTQSEESMTLMTLSGFPDRGSRSFTGVQDDVLPFLAIMTLSVPHR